MPKLATVAVTALLAVTLVLPGAGASAVPESAAAPARFVPTSVAGDAVVVDTTHHLVWETKTAGGSDHGVERTFTYQQALAYVDDLNRRRHGGRTDWRIPTEQELHSLVDLGQGPGRATIDPVAFPHTGRYFYWSSSRFTKTPVFQLSVTFASGSVFQWARTGRQHLRAVSGKGWTAGFDAAQPYDPATLHPDARNETVIDKVTGLQWEQKSHLGGVPLGPDSLPYYLQEIANAAKFTMVYPTLFTNFGADLLADPAAAWGADAASLQGLTAGDLVGGLPPTLLVSLRGVLQQYLSLRGPVESPLGPRSMHQLFTYAQAADHIDWLNDKGGRGYPGGYAGHRDWRLPTVDEMLTIADWDRGAPMVKEPFDPNFPSTYWTADIDPTTGRPFFFCTASLTTTSYVPASYGLFVRAVRGTPKPLEPRP